MYPYNDLRGRRHFMMAFLICIFSMMLILGICALLAGMTRYASYATAEGKVTKWLDCSCCDEGVQLEAGEHTKPVAAVISYKVGSETYQLTTAEKKVLKEGRAKGDVQVFYNPYNPAESRLKEGTPFLGFILIAVSSVAITLLIAL